MDDSNWSMFGCNEISFQLPDECITDCSHQGQCYDDCKFWQRKLNLNLDREKMISELETFGAWDNEELNALENDELEVKLIWIAACDIKEERYIFDLSGTGQQ